MSGFFGDEPTCARCDYPYRLHHLLGVEHGYTPREEEDGLGAAATAAEACENHPNTHEGARSMSQTTDRTPGGMTLSEAVSESVMIAALTKLTIEIGASDQFPMKVTFDELERFAQWAGSSVGELMQNAQDAVGAQNTAWTACTECRWRAEQDETPPTHAIVIGDDVSIVHDNLDELTFLFDLPDSPAGDSTAVRLESFGYRTTGPWSDLKMPNGDSAKIAPVQAVAK